MASMMAPLEHKEDRIIGIKLEINPGITPRDNSIGTKIFMLVPAEATTVRDVKSYIANFVLKTHCPFHLLMGEYRIRDEEDARIFSIINEPCKLEPIPIPRSALSLSSTPKPRSADKRVTFFDSDLSASPVHPPKFNGLDSVDHTQTGKSIPSPQQQEQLVKVKAPPPPTVKGDLFNIDCVYDSSPERKKRRRRRHRNKKSRRELDEDSDSVLTGMNGSQTTANDHGAISAAEKSAYTFTSDSVSTPKSQLEVLNEETESEDETAAQGNSRSKCSEFITPVSKLPRKRPDEFIMPQECKRKKLSDSAFESSSNLSPATPTEMDSRPAVVRVDTPTVPRRGSTRNVNRLEPARNAIDVLTTWQLKDQMMKDSKPDAALKIDNAFCYENLMPVQYASELNVGDEIAFKVLELDERYNPSVSSYKEGVVYEKEGANFRIRYTKNSSVVRTGKYDLVEDEEADLKSEKSENIDIQFSELLEPKFMPQKMGKATQQPCQSTDQHLPVNDQSTPSSII